VARCRCLAARARDRLAPAHRRPASSSRPDDARQLAKRGARCTRHASGRGSCLRAALRRSSARGDTALLQHLVPRTAHGVWSAPTSHQSYIDRPGNRHSLRAPLRLRGAARRAAAARAAWRRRGRPMAPRRMRRSRPAACARRGAGVASARARRRRQRASLGWSSATRWTRTAPSSGAQRASSRLGCRKGRARCFVRRRDAARGRAPATRRRAACHRSALLRRGRARRCRPHTRSALNLRCAAQSGVRGPCWPVAGLDRAPQSAAGALSPARRCLPRSRAAARGCRLAELAPCRSHRTLTACASRCAADDHGGLREDGGHARECAPSRAPRPRRAEGSRAAPA
jgi:hypothetical protein